MIALLTTLLFPLSPHDLVPAKYAENPPMAETTITEPLASDAQIYRGLYRSSFETSSFQPCDSSENWWLEIDPDHGEEISNLRQKVGADLGKDDFNIWKLTVLLEAQGSVSDAGNYGHLGQYDRSFMMTKVISAKVMDKGATACR